MKKILLKAAFLLLTLFTMLFVSSCKEETPDTSNDDGDFLGSDFTQDKLGYNRPASCWLTDTLLLPELPEDVTTLFGTGGEGHLASDYALSNDGNIEIGKTAYLVYLVYGTPGANTGSDSYLKFSLIDDGAVLYDDDFVTFGDASVTSVSGHYTFTHDVKSTTYEWRLRFTRDGKTAQNYAESIYFDKIQFAFVLPFKLKQAGTLCVDCRIDSDGNFEKEIVDDPYFLSFEGEKPYKAETSGLSVGYLTETEYNSGSFSDSDIKSVPSFEDGKNCYLVADFSYSALNGNNGESDVNFMVRSTGRGMLDITIEDAPTGRIFETKTEYGITLGAAFKLPKNAGESKKVRVIVRLKSVSGGGVDFDVFLSGGADLSLEGDRYVPQSVDTGPLALIFKLNSDKKSYALEKIYRSYVNLEIPEKAPDGLPITRIMGSAFSYGAKAVSLTIPSSITVIDENAFYSSDGIAVEIVNNSAIDVEAIFEQYGDDIPKPLDIHAGVSNMKQIGDFSFYTLSGKQYLVSYNGDENEVTLPDNYNGKSYEIYDYAFRGRMFEKIVIPEGVETIGAYAFLRCMCLREVYLPTSLKRIGRSAFETGYVITFDVYINDIEPWCEIVFEDENAYPLTFGGKLYVNGTVATDLPKPNIPESADTKS